MLAVVLCESGCVYAVGMNEFGCLGLGYKHSRTRAAMVLFETIKEASDATIGLHVYVQ